MVALPPPRPLPGATGLFAPAGLVLAVLLAATVGGPGVRGVAQLLDGPQAPAQVGSSSALRGAPALAVAVPALPARAAPDDTALAPVGPAVADAVATVVDLLDAPPER